MVLAGLSLGKLLTPRIVDRMGSHRRSDFHSALIAAASLALLMYGFAGLSQAVVVPVGAVLAIFAKENSQGIFFHDETGVKSTGEDDKSPTPTKRDGGAHLRLVE